MILAAPSIGVCITVIWFALMASLPYWNNFAIVSSYRYLREESFRSRGYGLFIDQVARNRSLNQMFTMLESRLWWKDDNFQKSKIIQSMAKVQLYGSVIRVIITYTVYAAVTASQEGLLPIKGYDLFDCKDFQIFSTNLMAYDLWCVLFILGFVET